MAIVPRKLKDGTVVYWVVTRGHGERSGLDRRAAERLDARRKKEAKAGTFAPMLSAAVKVGRYLEEWLNKRGRSQRVERSYLENHVLGREWFCAMRMDDVAPRHVQQLIEQIRDEQKLTHKTVHNIYSVLQSAFRTAEREDIVKRRVCMLAPKTLKPTSKEREPYTVDEIRALLAATKGPRLVWVALATYTGMRCGEVCGRRWRDWDAGPAPLGALRIATQYDDKPLKTDAPRVAPVLPELAAVLNWWKREGFELYYRRKPRPEDFIVPRLSDSKTCISQNAAYASWNRDCARAGVTKRTQHAMRHAFVTLLRRGGADVDVVEQITHRPKGAVIDTYTHRDWSELCKAASYLPSFRESVSGLGSLLDSESSTIPAGGGSARADSVHVNKRKLAKPTAPTDAADPLSSGSTVKLDAALDARPETEREAEAFRLALVEQTLDGMRGARPLAKAKPPAPYLARKRGSR